MNALQFITERASRGRHHFATEEAKAALAASDVATRAALRRLKKKGAIADPYRGFHVIVPPEYRQLGCLPAEQFVPQLMEHLGEVYYVGLLSAAQQHGAAHQKPQQFQVVTPKNRPEIQCGKTRVVFIARHNAAEVPTMPFNTSRGVARVSTPEATALDVVGYPQHCAGLDNVATILSELAETLDPEKLGEVALISPVTWAQRLGFLLEVVGAGRVAGPLAEHVSQRAARSTPLVPSLPLKSAELSFKWKVLVNTEVAPDL